MSAYLLLAEQLEVQARAAEEQARTLHAQAAACRELAERSAAPVQAESAGRLLTIADVCERWSCGETLVREEIAKGRLGLVSIGRRGLVRVTLASVELYEARHHRSNRRAS